MSRQEPALHRPHTFRLCTGRVQKHRWIKPKIGGFRCPASAATFVHKGLHTHRFRGAHFVMRLEGHKRTVRAEKFRLRALRGR